jgi:hypothetical protein
MKSLTRTMFPLTIHRTLKKTGTITVYTDYTRITSDVDVRVTSEGNTRSVSSSEAQGEAEIFERRLQSTTLHRTIKNG